MPTQPPSSNHSAIEQQVHARENRDKAVSLAVSLLAVALAFAALAWIVVFAPRPIPTDIAVTELDGEDSKPKHLIKNYGNRSLKPSRPSGGATSVIRTNLAAAFSIDAPEMVTDAFPPSAKGTSLAAASRTAGALVSGRARPTASADAVGR